MDPDPDAVPGPAVDALSFAALYDELHTLAHSQRRRSRPGETLSTTALLHEAYLKLAAGATVNDRRHFFALAARAMRQVLVDHARQRATEKRGAGRQVTTLGDEVAGVQADAAELLAIDTALANLQRVNERLGRVVELRFFGGLSVEETAETLGTSTATVKRDWRAARAFLVATLGAAPS
jgi:RNA polymerase sigma factor (TIGR02999 family)